MSFSEELKELMDQLGDAAQRVVPRFFRTMPRAYFREHDRASRSSHLKAIIAAETSGLSQELILRSGSGYTFINRASYPGQLAEMVERLPTDQPLRSASIHTASDGWLVLDVFELGPLAAYDPTDPEQRSRVEHLMEENDDLPLEELLPLCTSHYLTTTPTHLLRHHLELVRRLRNGKDTMVEWSSHPTQDSVEVTVGIGNAACRAMFLRVARHFGHRGVDIQRARLATFGEEVSILWFLVQNLDREEATCKAVYGDLERLNGLDQSALELAYELDWNLTEAELLVAIAHLAHQVLARTNPMRFTRQRILSIARQHAQLSKTVVARLQDRSHPPPPAATGVQEQPPDDRIVLACLARTAGAVRQTNLFAPGRQALALGLDPWLLHSPGSKPAPIGLCFVQGRDFSGFQVDVGRQAQATVQTLRPRDAEEYHLGTEHLYERASAAAPNGLLLVSPGSELAHHDQAFARAIQELARPSS